MKKIALSALLAALLAACASTPQPAPATPTVSADQQKADEAEAKRKADEAAAKAAADAAEAKRKADEAAAAKAQEDAYKDAQSKEAADKRITEGLLKSKSVYFDFNSYQILDDYKSLIDTHADFEKISGAKVRIEGNADERGSREYNLSLGQKRAKAVAEALEAQGVDKGTIETISNGKEKPVCTESNEDCWSVNRRADIFDGGDGN